MPEDTDLGRKRVRFRNILRIHQNSSRSSSPLQPISALSPAPQISSAQSLSTTPTSAVSLSADQPPSSETVLSIATDHFGKKLLDQVLRRLQKDDLTAIEKYVSSNEDINTVLQAAFTAAETKRDLCESNKWVVSFRGHTLQLKDEAQKVLSWLDRLKTIGDIAANADPVHAGLPWVGIRFLLEVRIIICIKRSISSLAPIHLTLLRLFYPRVVRWPLYLKA
jgi:hypothetical protein